MKNDALEALNRAWVEAELVMKPEFEAYYGTIRQSLTNAPEVEGLVSWLETIVSLPDTMNFCGNFTEEYKSGSRDGMRAAAVVAEQCLKILTTHKATAASAS